MQSEDPQKKEVSFFLNIELIKSLEEMAKERNQSLNDLVECILLDSVYYEPNEVTKAAMQEAMSGKLRNTQPIDLSSVEAMMKSMGL